LANGIAGSEDAIQLCISKGSLGQGDGRACRSLEIASDVFRKPFSFEAEADKAFPTCSSFFAQL
jgi:hypothetical protein